MGTGAPDPVRRRRHGEELESALLAAGWDELVEIGYARLTMESVAARARTGIAVLYRRWANKDQLVLASIQHYRTTHPITLPDTGDLRTDLIGYLTSLGEARAAVFVVATAAAFSGRMADIGLTPGRARDQVLGDQPLPHRRTIYLRAQERGEIDLENVPAAVLDLPFDLVRHDLYMDLAPPSPARIRSIVDELFLPLVRQFSGTPTGASTAVLRSGGDPAGSHRRGADGGAPGG